MKSLLQFFPLVILFSLSVNLARAAQIDAGTPLVITLHDSMDSLSLDEFHYLETAFKKVFAERGYKGELEVKRWGANVDEGSQALEVSLVLWKEMVPNELDCRLYTTVRFGEEKVDLGVSVGTSNHLAATDEMLRRKWRESAEKSVGKIIDKLTSKGLLTLEEQSTES